MSDLATQLRNLIDTAADPITLEEVTTRPLDELVSPSPGGAGRRAGRGAWWLAAAAIAIVLAAGAGLAFRSTPPPATVTTPSDDGAKTSPAGYIAESSQVLGLRVGAACPSTTRTGNPPRSTPSMDAVLAGDPSLGTCEVVAWMPRGPDPVVPPGYYSQDGTLLWDLNDPAAEPTFPAPPDQQTAEASQPSSNLGDIEPGVPYQRPVTGQRKDGSVGYIGTSTCVADGGSQRCYAEQLTADAFRPNGTTSKINAGP